MCTRTNCVYEEDKDVGCMNGGTSRGLVFFVFASQRYEPKGFVLICIREVSNFRCNASIFAAYDLMKGQRDHLKLTIVLTQEFRNLYFAGLDARSSPALRFA